MKCKDTKNKLNIFISENLYSKIKKHEKACVCQLDYVILLSK